MTEDDEFAKVVARLLATYAFAPERTQLPVVPIEMQSVTGGMTFRNFQQKMAPMSLEVDGPRGGVKRLNPADAWMVNSGRLTVAGLQLRPDRPTPIFEESKRTYINLYRPALHPAEGGDHLSGLLLLQQLLPEESERRWFIQWLAHKVRHPDVPGPAIVMVARGFGSGRGTLGKLLKCIFGGRYVKTVGFDIVAGRNYQSQYTDWVADALVVIVNESSTSEGSSPYRAKHDTYERLKETISPAAEIRQFVVKSLPAFEAPCFASYLIFTNNPDALPLPAGDRRFWVGTNGALRADEFWSGIYKWMDDPLNVGAFVRYLLAVDLSDYSPYSIPPMTRGKEAMTELSTSPMDRAFDTAMDRLPGAVFVPDQVLDTMFLAQDSSEPFPHEWRGHAARIVKQRTHRVGLRDGSNYHIRLGSPKKHAIYARTRQEADEWTYRQPDELRAEIEMNGTVEQPAGPLAAQQATRRSHARPQVVPHPDRSVALKTSEFRPLKAPVPQSHRVSTPISGSSK